MVENFPLYQSLYVYVCVIEWLLERWVTYEQTVSELLDWVMTEAETFAKEVTTRGDKGVVDHIKSCEVSNFSFCLFVCLCVLLYLFIHIYCVFVCLFMCLAVFVCSCVLLCLFVHVCHLSLLLTLLGTSSMLGGQKYYNGSSN